MAKRKIGDRKTGGWVETVRTLIWAGLIAIGFRTIAYEPFNIPSGSMKPTLLIGDYVFVSKFSYGYSHFSLPFSPPLFSGRIFGSLPRRGDVAVFRTPRDTSIAYIKRIIGLPGDRIQVREGKLYLNDAEVKTTPVGLYADDESGQALEVKRLQEALPEGTVDHPEAPLLHSILKRTSDGFGNNTQVFKVPPDTVFAMGDNRDNSLDSRFPPEAGGVGFVPLENLIGRAEIIFFSVDGTAPFWQFWQWPFEIRWSRLLMPIR